MPATVKFASSNGTVDTIAVKEWIAKNPPAYAQGFKRGFVTHYNEGYEAYQKMRDLAHRVPEHLRGHQAAGEDDGLPAQGADDARLHDAGTGRP